MLFTPISTITIELPSHHTYVRQLYLSYQVFAGIRQAVSRQAVLGQSSGIGRAVLVQSSCRAVVRQSSGSHRAIVGYFMRPDLV